jgi:hypothetical protein
MTRQRQPSEHRREDRVQSRSGQRRCQEDRRPCHRRRQSRQAMPPSRPASKSARVHPRTPAHLMPGASGWRGSNRTRATPSRRTGKSVPSGTKVEAHPAPLRVGRGRLIASEAIRLVITLSYVPSACLILARTEPPGGIAAMPSRRDARQRDRSSQMKPALRENAPLRITLGRLKRHAHRHSFDDRKDTKVPVGVGCQDLRPCRFRAGALVLLACR